MNKLLFSEGGQPLHLDDLGFLQNSFVDSIKGIVSPFGDVVLSGCVISQADNKTSWTQGYVVISGEIYKVDAGSLNGVPTVIYWKAVRTNEQIEVFENNSEHYVYQYGKATLAEVITGSDISADARKIRSMNDYLMTYQKKELTCIPIHNNTEATMTLFENNQGFHIVKITFKVNSKISFSLKPLFAYNSGDPLDFGKVEGTAVVYARGGGNAPLASSILIQQGAVYMYNSEGATSFTLEDGFNFSVTYTKAPV